MLQICLEETDPFNNKTMKAAAANTYIHDDVIKWKHFPRYWYFMMDYVEQIIETPVIRVAIMLIMPSL